MEKNFKVGGMSCSACGLRVEKAVKRVDGVFEVTVNVISGEMKVTFSQPANETAIAAAVRGTGYTVSIDGERKGEMSSDTKKTFIRLIASVILLLPLMYLSMGGMFGAPLPAFVKQTPLISAIIQGTLALIILIINGRFFVSGFKSIIRLSPNMDALVMIGSGASFLYSLAVTIKMGIRVEEASALLCDLYYEGSAMIVTLITVGKALEKLSKGRTTDAIKALVSLSPSTATILRNGEEIVVPVENVKLGDLFVVKTGDNVPVDGIIVEGGGAIDQANLTGESLPVDKTVGDEISSSTINTNGYIVARATRVGKDTAINQIIETVRNASLTKAPIAKTADKVASVFVPAVMLIAVITFAVWLIVGSELAFALKKAVAVLVISCPCALGLATPVAIMVGAGVGAKNGALYKNAASLEALGKCKIAVVDKTGTITYGKPTVTDVFCKTEDEQRLKKIAVALESLSSHPLAKAVIEAFDEIGDKIDDFEELSGLGVKGCLNGVVVAAGNAKLMGSLGVDVGEYTGKAKELALNGKTPLFFSENGVLLGVIALADKPKAEAKSVISALKHYGVQTYMLTGDNRATALAIAKSVGINEENVISDVMPNDKQAEVMRLKKYGKVAMIGDGVNDAPALSSANVGVAVASGSFVAVDAAEIVVMNDLTSLLFAFKLSKRVILNVKENLFWAFVYNVIGIPVAAGAFYAWLGLSLSPMLAAAAMSLSSLFVVGNALRLNLVKPDAVEKSSDFISNNALKTQKIEQNNIKEDVMKEIINVKGMMCGHCEASVEKAVTAIDGVLSCKACHETGKVTVEYSAPATLELIKSAIKAKDYQVID